MKRSSRSRRRHASRWHSLPGFNGRLSDFLGDAVIRFMARGESHRKKVDTGPGVFGKTWGWLVARLRLRRRVNYKLVIATLGAILVLGLGVHGLHAVQVQRNARSLLRNADIAEEQGKSERVERCLKLYLGFVPTDTETLARYGLTLEKQKAPGARVRAAEALEQVLARAPGRTEVRRRLVRLTMDLRDYSAAAAHLKILLKAAPFDGELEQLLGECRERQGEFAEAANWFERAFTHAPGQIESYRRLASLARRELEQPQRGDDAMDRMVEKNGRSFQAVLARGRYRLQYKLKGADADIARARVLEPDNPDVLLAAAEAERDAGEIAKARESLASGLERFPQDYRWYKALAELELAAGRIDAVRDCLERGVKALPESVELWLSLADAQIRAGTFEKATATLADLRMKKWGDPLMLDFLEARILLARQLWREAAQALDRLAPMLVYAPVLAKQAYLSLSLCQQRLGNPDLQLDASRRAVSVDLTWVPARLALASALLATGRDDDALTEYKTLIPQWPEARIAVARLVLLQNLQRPAAQRRWADVEQVVDEAKRAFPDSADVTILGAEVQAAQNHVDRALALLVEASQAHPRTVSLWTTQAALLERNGAPAKALELLDQTQQRLGDSVELRVARARYWSAQRGDPEPEKAKAKLSELADHIDTFGREDQIQLLEGLAEAAMRLGEPADSRRYWALMAERDPQRLRPHVFLFDLASRADDAAAMQRELGMIKQIEGPNGLLGSCAEAALHIARARRGDRAGLGAVRLQLAAVANRRPAWGRPALLEAEIAELQGDQPGAIDAYLRAIERGERQPWTIRRAVQLLTLRHRYAEADQAIRALEKQAPISGELSRMAAEVSLLIQNPDRALELARQAVSADSKDYRDQIWLGQVLAASGKTAEAEAALRKAITLAGDSAAPWVALVRFLAWSGRPAQAEAAIEEAAKRLPADRVPLTLALCDEALDRRDRAEVHYREALKAKPDDPVVVRCAANFQLAAGHFATAEPHLRHLIDPAIKVDPGDRAWARRNLAAGLAIGDDRQYREALALIEENLKASGVMGGLLEDRRAKIVIQATRPEHRSESIQALEELIGKQPPTPEEQFLLAQLYEANRDWPRARVTLLSLAASSPKNARYLAYLVRALLTHDEVDAAAQWFERLEGLEPRVYRTVELKARLRKMQGQPAEAVTLLTEFSKTPGAPLPAIAAFLEELGQSATADAMFRAFAQRTSSVGSTLALAEFLGRQRRTGEALDLCDQVWEKGSPELVGASSLAVLLASQPDDRAYQRVVDRLERAIAAHPDMSVLRAQMATLRIVQGRYRDAEEQYRQTVKRNPRDVMALNNLAWLLTLNEGRHADALDLINRAIEIAGPKPSLLDTRGLIVLGLGRNDDAIHDLLESIRERPTAAGYLHLAYAHLVAKDRIAASQAMQRATEAGLNGALIHPLERPLYDRLSPLVDRGATATPTPAPTATATTKTP